MFENTDVSGISELHVLKLWINLATKLIRLACLVTTQQLTK